MDHIPVLVSEVLEYLISKRGGVYLDGTVGCGGHASEILRALDPGGGRLLAADWDAGVLKVAAVKLAPFGKRVSLYHRPFSQIPSVLAEAGETEAQGVLLDLGLSSYQLGGDRGFSFQGEDALDMRMDERRTLTAQDIVNGWGEDRLRQLFREYGEERRAGRIARAVVRARPFRSGRELAAVVARAHGGRRGGIHPATRVFQALRIAVNDELEELRSFLDVAHRLLAPGGRLVIISFHSLEDRLVKSYLKGAGRQYFTPLTKKPVRPREEEIKTNRRARSARLRAAERIGPSV